jgi:hypothetical protein
MKGICTVPLDDCLNFAEKTSKIMRACFASLSIDDIRNLVNAVSLFFARPYWERAWVLQEMALASDLVFLCGSSYIRWIHLMIGHIYLQTNFTRYIGYFESLGGSTPSYLLAVARPRVFDIQPQTMKCLLMAINLKVTDPRDRVFSLTNAASDGAALKIQPDYSRSCKDVYVQLAVSYLDQGDLEILGACQFPKKIPGLPSWVPDWTANLCPVVRSSKLPYSASGDRNSRVAICSSDDGSYILSVRGSSLGTVQHLGLDWGPIRQQLNRKESPTELGLEFTANLIIDLLQLDPLLKTYDANLPSEDPLFIVPVLDMVVTSKDHNPVVCRASTDPVFWNSYANLYNLKEKIIGDPVILWDSARIYVSAAFQTVVQQRKRFFVTNNGSLGIAFDNLRVDDLVCVFDGYSNLVIIREDSPGRNLWQFMGEAFVHGFMDGELFSGEDPPAIEVFQLV